MRSVFRGLLEVQVWELGGFEINLFVPWWHHQYLNNFLCTKNSWTEEQMIRQNFQMDFRGSINPLRLVVYNILFLLWESDHTFHYFSMSPYSKKLWTICELQKCFKNSLKYLLLIHFLKHIWNFYWSPQNVITKPKICNLLISLSLSLQLLGSLIKRENWNPPPQPKRKKEHKKPEMLKLRTI